MIDLYTFNFAYLGSRRTGNDGGSFLVAGLDWKGATPPGIAKVLRSETKLAMVAYRTQLFQPTDLENVREVQAGYKVEPLSSFLGEPAPPAAPQIDFIEPLSPAEERTSLDFFNELAFVLQFCPTHPSEVALRERFAKIGIVPGRPFGTAFLSSEMKSCARGRDGRGTAGNRRSTEGNKVVRRHVWYARVLAERLHESCCRGPDRDLCQLKGRGVLHSVSDGFGGQPLDGSHRYTLTFAAEGLPPVKAFWSLTMYSLPQQQLVANSIDRYLINSPMLPDMVRDADGGITIAIQQRPPAGDRDANWLPAPDGPFMMVLRLYWPEQAVLDGAWQRRRWSAWSSDT